MSWDGLYVKDRSYPEFEKGDEVYTDRKYGALTKNQGYTVLDCFNPYPHKPESNARVIILKNDMGFEERYGSFKFKKTERQLILDSRENKIKQILNG